MSSPINPKEKIAFVCQRYGLEVNGGAEMSCRMAAEHLSVLYDVTVYTTCALDYTTWANHYPAGEEVIHNVHVKRYPVKSERDPQRFDRILSQVLSSGEHSDDLEQQWVDEQGPLCPELIDALAREHRLYRAVFFMTYLYYTSTRGLPLRMENAVLIPTAHDEPPIWLRIYDQVFSSARYLVWHSEEEQAFCRDRFPSIQGIPSSVIGMGIDSPSAPLPPLPAPLAPQSYLVYAGRIDESKGCREMFSWFTEYRKHASADLKLVLMGKPILPIPDHPDIISLGFVSEELKYAVMEQSLALVLFSRFESFSIVVLESMMMGRPVLVNGECAVLKEHCRKSNAGLYFQTYGEFHAEVEYLLSHPDVYEVLRKNGRSYVAANYQWDVVTRKYVQVIESFPPAAGGQPD